MIWCSMNSAMIAIWPSCIYALLPGKEHHHHLMEKGSPFCSGRPDFDETMTKTRDNIDETMTKTSDKDIEANL